MRRVDIYSNTRVSFYYGGGPTTARPPISRTLTKSRCLTKIVVTRKLLTVLLRTIYDNICPPSHDIFGTLSVE